MSQEQRPCMSPSPSEEHQTHSSRSWVSLATLPPEVLEKIFGFLAHNVASLRSVAGVCSQFHQIACRVS